MNLWHCCLKIKHDNNVILVKLKQLLLLIDKLINKKCIGNSFNNQSLMLSFQFLKCEDLLLFSVFTYLKINVFRQKTIDRIICNQSDY